MNHHAHKIRSVCYCVIFFHVVFHVFFSKNAQNRNQFEEFFYLSLIYEYAWIKWSFNSQEDNATGERTMKLIFV